MAMRINIAANLGGRLWASVISLAAVPVYLRILGIEAYGLIGFFTSLIAVFLILDMGLSTAINRELSRLSGGSDNLARQRDLVRTFEAVYWPIGVALAIGTIAAAPWIADHWLRTTELSREQVRQALQLMGLVIVFRWPIALYSGALLGLQRQVRMNVIVAASATLQAAGAVIVLSTISPSVIAFFAWQCFATLVQVGLLALAVWRGLQGPGERPRITLRLIRDVFAFSAGVAGITVLSVVLTQLDKVVLSRMLPLAEFGTYALANTIASSLSIAATSVYNSAFPLFSRQTAAGDTAGLARSYHASSQSLAILVAPPAIAIILFAEEILAIYTGSPSIAAGSHVLLSILTSAAAILALMLLPLALQFAHGWVRLSLYKNLIAVVLYVPALLFAVRELGTIGAALVWLALPCCYFLLEIPVMHSRVLPEEKWRWYFSDLALPFAAAAFPLIVARLALPAHSSVAMQIGVIALAGIASVVAAMLASSHPRQWVREQIDRRGSWYA